MGICKRAILCFCTVFSLILSQLFSTAYMPVTAKSSVPDIFLEWKYDESTGIYILFVMLELNAAELCGLELDITYESNIISLSSCERGDALEGLGFDCSLSDKKIRLLLWGTSNSRNGGRLATVCFAPVADASESGKCEFVLSLPTDCSAIYFEGDGIYTADVNLTGISVLIENNLQDERESPSENINTEIPTQQHTETPPQIHEVNPPRQTPSEPENSNCTDYTFTKVFSRVLVCISSTASALTFLPYLFRDIFRKGYF